MGYVSNYSLLVRDPNQNGFDLGFFSLNVAFSPTRDAVIPLLIKAVIWEYSTFTSDVIHLITFSFHAAIKTSVHRPITVPLYSIWFTVCKY